MLRSRKKTRERDGERKNNNKLLTDATVAYASKPVNLAILLDDENLKI
jgi:hypothetical protein